MCIAIIKRSKNPEYSFIIGLNRDEKYSNRWEKINNHWKDRPDIYGYKDKLSGGTWLAYNKNILAILINKESHKYENLNSRAFIILDSLKNADAITKSIDNLNIIDMSKYKPFNLILLSSEQLVYTTNFYDDEIRSNLSFEILEDEFIMLNRSMPNDMNETRIASNFYKFKNAKEPFPPKSDWKEWEELLTTECFSDDPNQETCLWLKSKEWGTLSSDIITLSNDKNKYPLIYTIKQRKLN